MKKLTLLLSFIACVAFAHAQVLINEGFDYPIGTELKAIGWVLTGTSTVNPIMITTTTIFYPFYPNSGIGNEITLNNNGQDLNKSFTPQTSGVIYVSVLANITSAQVTGDYFLHINESPTGTTFFSRLFVKLDGSKLAFGIMNTSGGTFSPTYTTSSYDLNTTYLLVMKYDISNNIASLIVNPTISTIEPSTNWISNNSGTSLPPIAGFSTINLRQGSMLSAPTLKLDGLRVGQIWSSIFFGNDSTNPFIQLAPNQLNGFIYDKGAGPSAEQTFSLDGYNLTSDITIAPPTNFQISKTSGSGFTSLPIILTQNAGCVDITKIYVRLKAGLNFGNYTDSILLSSIDATVKKVYCSGTVVGPTINPSITSLSNLNYNKGSGPSAEQSFSISGSVLESDIILTPSANLQLSKTSGSGFVGTPITLTQNAGIINSTNIYVRLKAGLNFANYLDSISITSTNAITKKVLCSGIVVGPTLNNSVSSLTNFSYVNDAGPSTYKLFTISGSLLEANVTITPSTNYEISTNNSVYISTPIVLTPTTGTLSTTSIYVRLKAGLTAGAYIENISIQSTGAASKTISCSGTVLGPKITISTSTISRLNYIYDSGPSDQQSFTVSGSDLTSNIIITPNSNFQISTVSGGSFSTSAITLTQLGGIANSTTIYVRLKAGLTGGNYTGNITLTSTNADTKTITCGGTVDNGTGLTYNVSVPAGTMTCYIAGTMNSWVPQAMTKTDGMHYYVTIPNSSLTDTYKYYSGPNVNYIEKDGAGADIVNRSYSANDVVVGWAAIYDPTPYYNITLQIGANGTVKENNVTLTNGGSVSVASGTTKAFTITPDAGYEVATLTYNGADVKSQISNNQYTTPAITNNGLLSVSFVVISAAPQLINSNVKVYSTQSNIIIEGTTEGETVALYTANGVQLQTLMSQGERMVITAQRDAVYLIKTESKTFKVIL